MIIAVKYNSVIYIPSWVGYKFKRELLGAHYSIEIEFDIDVTVQSYCKKDSCVVKQFPIYLLKINKITSLVIGYFINL